MKHLNKHPTMAILWSITFPGFGQTYNHQFLKATLFMLMEFVINLNGHLNPSIIHSFFWEIPLSQSVLDYRWIMFYPCVYVIPMWDAYAVAYKQTYSFYPPASKSLPFAIGAMFATIGVIYGSRLVPGPIFLPIILIIVGSLIGNWISRRLQKKRRHYKQTKVIRTKHSAAVCIFTLRFSALSL